MLHSLRSSSSWTPVEIDDGLVVKLMRDIVTAFALAMHEATNSEVWQGCDESLKNVISGPKAA